MSGEEALIHVYTRVQRPPFEPEFQLYLADALVPLWQATEWRSAAPQPPPFWAFAWPGSQALARYILDTPGVVEGKCVLDFGSGGGLAAIAAAHLRAAAVVAVDLDPLAAAAQQLNAELNGMQFESRCADVVDAPINAEVVLAGDVCYEREPAERTLAWLRSVASSGVVVLLADPGRSYAPSDSQGLELLATYDIPTLLELESILEKRTRLWRLLAI